MGKSGSRDLIQGTLDMLILRTLLLGAAHGHQIAKHIQRTTEEVLQVAGGLVRAEILGPARKLTVTYFRRIDEVVPFEEVERKTPKLPEGVRALGQRGIPGFKTTSSRVVRDGAYALREKWSDAYPPTTQIIHVGTGPKDDNYKASDDPHPEYLVDEYLVVTQGPDLHSPGVAGASMIRKDGSGSSRLRYGSPAAADTACPERGET